MKAKIFSSLDMNKSKPTAEHTLSDDDSFLDIEFDKTEDDLLSTMGNCSQKHSTINRISTDFNLHNNKDTSRQVENEQHRLSREFDHHEIRNRKSSINNISNYPSSPKKVLQEALDDDDPLRVGDKPKTKLIDSYDTLEELEKEDHFDENKFGGLGQFKSGTSINNQMNALSQSLIKQRLSKPSLGGLNELKIDNRPHQFVTKKVFRPEKCGPCGQAIGFCTSAYRCRDCRAICHMSCKDQVPLPCIPYVSRANIGKQGKLVLISDFTPQNVRPCVPALIVHCCTHTSPNYIQALLLLCG